MLTPPLFFIFGLSGVGKTTLVENICKNKCFYQARQVVTRAPRNGDDLKKFEYVSKELFLLLHMQKQFLIEYDDGINCYAYRKNSLSRLHTTLLYGLPAKLDAIKKIGGICILIQGDAKKGLRIRGDDQQLIEQREKCNKHLQAEYYAQPNIQNKMDMIITNKFEKIESMINLFERFVFFKKQEFKALKGHFTSLLSILSTYHHPIEGMRYKHEEHAFWIRLAFQNKQLCFLFYSTVINKSRLFLEPVQNLLMLHIRVPLGQTIPNGSILTNFDAAQMQKTQNSGYYNAIKY